MTLPAPKLDDRDWNDLVDEARRRIAAKCPDWTDFNASDPGMMLIELMAWMTETVLYRMNRIPEKNYVKFLELIGVRLQPARPARTRVVFEVRSDAPEEQLELIPAGMRVSTRPQGDLDVVPFVTSEDLHLTTCKIVKTFSRYRTSSVAQEDAVHHLFGENAWEAEIFDRPKTASPRGLAVPHHIYLGDPAVGQFDARKIAVKVLVEFENQFTDQLLVEWEAWDGESWQTIVPDDDTTAGFTKDGDVLFTSLPAMRKCDVAQRVRRQTPVSPGSPEGEDDSNKLFNWLRQQAPVLPETQRDWGAALWLRARLVSSKGDQLPTLTRVQFQMELKACLLVPQNAFVGGGPSEDLADSMPYAPPQVLLQRVETSTEFRPYGAKGTTDSVFYLASDVFQKRGAAIEIQFTLRKSLLADVTSALEISWEYKSESGDWRMLGRSTPSSVTSTEFQFQDQTGAFTRSGSVKFICPEDIVQTEVGGQAGYFIRARVEQAGFASEGAGLLIVSSVLLKFSDVVRTWAHCITENYAELKWRPANVAFCPFIIDETQDPAFYLCFDHRPSADRGPYRLFLDVVPQVVPPQGGNLCWEYSGPRGWRRLEVVKDGTDAFAHAGAIEFHCPRDWETNKGLAREGYWLRVRWEIAEFVNRPRLRRVLLNTVEVVQAVPYERVLGSSTGLAGQSLSLNISILDRPQIWVRESDVSADAAVAALNTPTVSGTVAGDKESWVEWKEVRNFSNSNRNDRHFAADLGQGIFTFGDGIHGAIPPKGRENVRVCCSVALGSKGNVGSNTIVVLDRSLPQVQGVTNVHPAEGGCDREDIESAKQRGPWELKHRNRAVTEEDFVELAKKASPEVAKASCYQENGIIYLIIVPNDPGEKPQPSQRLIQDVSFYLDDKRLINTRLKVRGPFYELIDARIAVVLQPQFLNRFREIKQQIEERLRGFVHPLTGMEDHSGWPMGRTLHLSELYYLLEGMEGVEYVNRLEIRRCEAMQIEERIKIDQRSFPCFSQYLVIEQFVN